MDMALVLPLTSAAWSDKVNELSSDSLDVEWDNESDIVDNESSGKSL
jgi:hypothetical protein